MGMGMGMGMERMKKKIRMAEVMRSGRLGNRPASGVIFIGLLGIVFSYLTLANAISNIHAKTNPDRALFFWQNDEAQLAKTDQFLTTLDEKPVREKLVVLTRKSVQDSSLNAGVIRNYALAKMYDGNQLDTAAVLNVAQRVSRRDLGTQLQLATSAANGNDLDKALRHYSIALSTHVASHELIFPVLLQAIGSKLIDTSFRDVISTKPLWANEFISFVLAQGNGAEDLARVLRRSTGVPAGPNKAMLEKRIVQALVNDGAADEVRAFYLSLAGADETLLVSTSVSTNDFVIDMPPVSWTMTRTSEILTEFVTNRQALRTEIAARMSGVVAQKMIFFPAASYDIMMQSQIMGQTPGASLSWNMFCISKTEPLKLVKSGASRSARVNIDQACPAQLLEIRGDAGPAADGMVALISGFDVQERKGVK